MNKGQSIHAAAAIEALHACAVINPIIRGAICDPRLGPPENHPNAGFFEATEWYLTCRQVAHAGDTFNTYCQNILADILAVDPGNWSLLQKRKFRSKSCAEAIEKLRIQGELDQSVREALRESLGAYWCSEVEIVVELRHRIVHQAGMDPGRKVAATINSFPPGMQVIYPVALDPHDFPVAVDEMGKLVIDARTANWATHHVLHHIHQMDQNLCHRFALPRRKTPIPKMPFRMSQDSTALSIPAGKPLPQPPKTTRIVEPGAASLSPFPEYNHTMASPTEIACARKWNEVRDAIHKFVHLSCADYGVWICGYDGTLAGSLHSHTIEGHDHHLGYQLCYLKRPSDTPKYLGIRLRQEKFEPYITVWGTNAQMRDFRPCELTQELKSYIEDCIGHAVSR